VDLRQENRFFWDISARKSVSCLGPTRKGKARKGKSRVTEGGVQFLKRDISQLRKDVELCIVHFDALANSSLLLFRIGEPVDLMISSVIVLNILLVLAFSFG